MVLAPTREFAIRAVATTILIQWLFASNLMPGRQKLLCRCRWLRLASENRLKRRSLS